MTRHVLSHSSRAPLHGGAYARPVLACAAVVAWQAGIHRALLAPGAQVYALALVALPLATLMLCTALRSPRRAFALPLWALACAALWRARGMLAQHVEWSAYAEHVAFCATLAYGFGRTLRAGATPLCTRIAISMHDGAPGPAVLHYTRGLTLAWTLFFAAVAGVSTLLFATAPPAVWSTFANYLTLPLAGAMFVAEYGWRRIALPAARRPGLAATARAWRSASARPR